MKSFRFLVALTVIFALLSVSVAFGRAEFTSAGRDFRGNMSTATSVPECVADHQVGELVLAVNNNGTFGTGFQEAASGDCFTGGQVKSCEYPKGSNQSYLFAGSFWIGAVVGRDTLVSVGADGWSFTRELTPDRLPMTKRSIIDPNSPEFAGAVSEEDIISYYTDSVTSSVAADPFDGPHRPLFINVTERSYAWSYAYAEDFVLFDYQITNISNRTLEKVYMGLYNDGDVCFDCGNGGYSDDLTGFLQTINRNYGACTYLDTVFIAWLADNNGDLLDLHPVPNVTGMRVIRTPAETLDVSYNWWYSAGSANLDFGPRERSYVGRLKEPFRDFGTGGLGTPETDRNKYYIMRNKEFDYDQAFTATISSTDTLWLYPDPEQSAGWAVGNDTRYLLSFGPFDIIPGQTLPLTFAYVAGADFHSVPDNLNNLPYDPQAYYDNLNFQDLGENSTWASWIYDNPGVDTDSDGYAGEYRICVEESTYVGKIHQADSGWVPTVADTVWYIGDGVPDFRGASPPPAPKVWVSPTMGTLRIRFNGTYSETARDLFTHERDFEGYRVYISRDNRDDSYSVLTSWDKEDYNRYVFNPSRRLWEIKEAPFTREQLSCLYGDSCNDPNFDPLFYTRNNPLQDPSDPTKYYYFAKQDYNASTLGGPRHIRKVYDVDPPTTTIPDSADPDELTPEGLFKYYEYEYVIDSILPTVPYYVNVTAFDYGSPQSGLPALETSRTIGSVDAYPLPADSEVTANQLKVIVYPNPYRLDGNYRGLGFEGRAESDRPDDRVRDIHFANLPAKCTISIYTLDGDLVRQIVHDKSPADPNNAHDTWDMITRNTQLVVSGLYYWVVESESGDVQIGKLAIIM